MELKVVIRSDADGHWVDWTKGHERGSLGPDVDPDMAENVRAAKEAALLANDKPIDSAN